MTTPLVPSITDEQIAELESLANNATPGPWWIDSHGHRMSSEDGMKTVFITNDKMAPATRHKETGNLSHWPNDWDASFIAEANPAVVLALISRLRAAEMDAERYRFIRSRYRKVGFLSCDSQKAKYFDEYMICGERMDDAIDAAMQEHNQ